MKARLTMVIVALAMAGSGFMAAPATAEPDCDAYPIGRCGNSDREVVIFCWRLGMPAGVYLTGTDPAATTVAVPRAPVSGAPGAVPFGKALLHFRHAPSDAFLADPYEAELPFDSVYEESNAVGGLQTSRVKCGQFVWYAECDSWMGPYGIGEKPADRVVL